MACPIIITYVDIIVRTDGEEKKNDIAGAGRDGCGSREQGPVGLWASGERVVQLTRWG